MYKLTCILPLFWGSIAGTIVATNGEISESTPITLGLFLAGIVGTVIIVWRVRGQCAIWKSRLDEMDRRISRLKQDEGDDNAASGP